MTDFPTNPTAASPATALANPWLPQTARIVEVAPEIPGVATYRLRLDDPHAAANYSFRPGQFNMVYVPGWGESAISLSGWARGGHDLWHTIRVAGNVTRRISELPVGATLGLRGPFGQPWPLEACSGQDLLLVAGGIGLAPLRPVIYHVLQQRGRYGHCTLVVGARSPDLLLYEREFAAWREGGWNVLTTVDRADEHWHGAIGVVTLLVDRLQPLHPARTQVFICGPDVMMKYALQSAQRRGVAPQRIWLSLERNMQCAVGFCGHCQFGPAFVCKDGPVLAAERLGALLHVHQL